MKPYMRQSARQILKDARWEFYSKIIAYYSQEMIMRYLIFAVTHRKSSQVTSAAGTSGTKMVTKEDSEPTSATSVGGHTNENGESTICSQN